MQDTNKTDKLTKPTYAEVTEAMIQDWKAAYGDAEGCIYQHEIRIAEKKDGEAYKGPIVGFYLCVPSRTVVDRVAQMGSEKNIEGVNKCLIANCVLGGDLDVLERDGNVYQSVLTKIQELQKLRVSSVKKL